MQLGSNYAPKSDRSANTYAEPVTWLQRESAHLRKVAALFETAGGRLAAMLTRCSDQKPEPGGHKMLKDRPGLELATSSARGRSMKLWVPAFAGCFLAFGRFALQCEAAEPAPVANADAGDIDRAVAEYTDAFVKGDLEGVVAHCGTPFVIVSTNGTTVLTTPAEIEARYVGVLWDLRQRGYADSKRKEAHIKLLDKNLALVSAAFVRYREDGSELESVGATYLLRKGDGGWKIVENISHPADRVIR
jgi:hypothetical protein